METIFIIGCGKSGLTAEVIAQAHKLLGKTDVILVDVDATPIEKLKELGMPTPPKPPTELSIPISNPYAELEPLRNIYYPSKDDTEPWRKKYKHRNKKRR